MKRIVLNFILINLLSYQIQADENRAEQKTPIMITTVVKAEDQIKGIKNDIDRLWHACYEYVYPTDGYVMKKIDENTTVSQPTYSWKRELRRKISCTDAKIDAHDKCEQNLQKKIDESVQSIKKIASDNPSSVDAQDARGYTAVDYCYTYELYQELRRQGAEFKIISWIYFYPITATVSMAAATCASYYGYHKLFAQHDDHKDNE